PSTRNGRRLPYECVRDEAVPVQDLPAPPCSGGAGKSLCQIGRYDGGQQDAIEGPRAADADDPGPEPLDVPQVKQVGANERPGDADDEGCRRRLTGREQEP